MIYVNIKSFKTYPDSLRSGKLNLMDKRVGILLRRTPLHSDKQKVRKQNKYNNQNVK